MGWASAAEALVITGATVTDAQLDQAQSVLDLYADVTTAALPGLAARNVRLLKAAHAYQAVWMANQIDVLTRTAVASISQDGVSVVPAGPDALHLAPLAAKALSHLSWFRNATVTVANGVRRYSTFEAYAADWLRDESPDTAESDWIPVR